MSGTSPLPFAPDSKPGSAGFNDAFATKLDVNASLGAVAYSATVNGTTFTENVNGVTVTTTVAPGIITVVYGAPLNQTWQTTIAAGSISTVRTA